MTPDLEAIRRRCEMAQARADAGRTNLPIVQDVVDLLVCVAELQKAELEWRARAVRLAKYMRDNFEQSENDPLLLECLRAAASPPPAAATKGEDEP